MCGRYAAAKDTAALVEQFAIAEVVDPAPAANYNVAPTTEVAMIVESASQGHRQLRLARWGLVPAWAKDVKVGARMINARWESLPTKTAFRVPFARRRAVLPADGYFEWYRPAAGGPKVPYFIHAADGSSLALAGLFDFWRAAPEDPLLVSATILTTAATGALGAIHDRMPVMLPPAELGAWLAREVPYAGQCPRLPADALVAHPVGTAVNSVRNNGPELLVPLPAAEGPDPAARGREAG